MGNGKQYAVVYLEEFDDNTSEWSLYSFADSATKAMILRKEAWDKLSPDRVVVDKNEVQVWPRSRYLKYSATGVA